MTCAHEPPFLHDGPRTPLRYGSAPTEVCSWCGMYRTMHHTPGDWRCGPVPVDQDEEEAPLPVLVDGQSIYEAIDRGGGQACDVQGVIRELRRAGFAILPLAKRTGIEAAKVVHEYLNLRLKELDKGDAANIIHILFESGFLRHAGDRQVINKALRRGNFEKLRWVGDVGDDQGYWHLYDCDELVGETYPREEKVRWHCKTTDWRDMADTVEQAKVACLADYVLNRVRRDLEAGK